MRKRDKPLTLSSEYGIIIWSQFEGVCMQFDHRTCSQIAQVARILHFMQIMKTKESLMRNANVTTSGLQLGPQKKTRQRLKTS